MTVTGMTAEQLQSAAKTTGVTLDMTSLSQSGLRHRVKVNLGEDRDLYRKITCNMGHERRVNAVCWHGFRDFFRACFELAPNAKFSTALDTWKGSADFEARYRESGTKNIGSQMYPMLAAEACDCGEGAR